MSTWYGRCTSANREHSKHEKRFLAAVLVSNVPQAIAPSADLAEAGWSAGRTARLWLAVVASCGVAAALGWLGATAFPDANGDRAAALAAGGLLAMLTNSLMPFAYERGGELAGVPAVADRILVGLRGVAAQQPLGGAAIMCKWWSMRS